MLYKAVAACTLVLSLSGCLSPTETLNEKQGAYIGKNANALIAQLGMPDSEGVVAGKKYYAWVYQNSGSYTLPQRNTGTVTTTNYGYGYPSYGTGTYSYTTYKSYSFNHQCRLRAFLDNRGNILTFDLEGNNGGCSRLVDRL